MALMKQPLSVERSASCMRNCTRNQSRLKGLPARTANASPLEIRCATERMTAATEATNKTVTKGQPSKNARRMPLWVSVQIRGMCVVQQLITQRY